MKAIIWGTKDRGVKAVFSIPDNNSREYPPDLRNTCAFNRSNKYRLYSLEDDLELGRCFTVARFAKESGRTAGFGFMAISLVLNEDEHLSIQSIIDYLNDSIEYYFENYVDFGNYQVKKNVKENTNWFKKRLEKLEPSLEKKSSDSLKLQANEFWAQLSNDYNCYFQSSARAERILFLRDDAKKAIQPNNNVVLQEAIFDIPESTLLPKKVSLIPADPEYKEIPSTLPDGNSTKTVFLSFSVPAPTANESKEVLPKGIERFKVEHVLVNQSNSTVFREVARGTSSGKENWRYTKGDDTKRIFDANQPSGMVWLGIPVELNANQDYPHGNLVQMVKNQNRLGAVRALTNGYEVRQDGDSYFLTLKKIDKVEPTPRIEEDSKITKEVEETPIKNIEGESFKYYFCFSKDFPQGTEKIYLGDWLDKKTSIDKLICEEEASNQKFIIGSKSQRAKTLKDLTNDLLWVGLGIEEQFQQEPYSGTKLLKERRKGDWIADLKIIKPSEGYEIKNDKGGNYIARADRKEIARDKLNLLKKKFLDFGKKNLKFLLLLVAIIPVLFLGWKLGQSYLDGKKEQATGVEKEKEKVEEKTGAEEVKEVEQDVQKSIDVGGLLRKLKKDDQFKSEYIEDIKKALNQKKQNEDNDTLKLVIYKHLYTAVNNAKFYIYGNEKLNRNHEASFVPLWTLMQFTGWATIQCDSRDAEISSNGEINGVLCFEQTAHRDMAKNAFHPKTTYPYVDFVKFESLNEEKNLRIALWKILDLRATIVEGTDGLFTLSGENELDIEKVNVINNWRDLLIYRRFSQSFLENKSMNVYNPLNPDSKLMDMGNNKYRKKRIDDLKLFLKQNPPSE
jgi:predicted negative regulator of RcsB-dependent stress response